MRRRTRSSLLWGAVGGLAFLVLVQAWHLSGGERIAVPVAVGVALAVAAVATGVAFLAEGRRVARSRRNQRP